MFFIFKLFFGHGVHIPVRGYELLDRDCARVEVLKNDVR